jgi:hypothetical protein
MYAIKKLNLFFFWNKKNRQPKIAKTEILNLIKTAQLINKPARIG